ncbi:DUF6209 family protein [Mucilaginibacter paludis]|uniref:Uncharacterized protein n=1 Tax=Mucilaginibacter paludis DSM 18603 TaxID=714943 RepID=H1YE15_9SPHI|nr:DUF6209 family protein [Mucilaginibacter paludis]EHQ25193.1 hypothetical protein Mucpa_1019 [Mucilaginibacter paludis DSM 18603]
MSHLIFTLDFHEIVRGKLKKGQQCTINYDPLRLATSKEGFVHGSPDFEFTAYVLFKPTGQQTVKLSSDTGIVPDAVPQRNGQGAMLTGNFEIPENAEEIITWISMKDNHGEYFYDSDFGKNFHFRLETEDIKAIEPSVTNHETSGLANFSVKVTTSATVDQVMIRYRVSNGSSPLTEIPVGLVSIPRQDGLTDWSTPDIDVPYGAVTIFDLIYFVDGERYIVENNGNYFITEAV